MKIKNLSLLFLALLVLSGCYTRFGSFEGPGEQYSNLGGVDSLGDSTAVSDQVDTIIYRDKEICIWERDFTGMPRLRCFPSYYPRDWFFYNNSPWWFRTSAYWYDYKRCPRYYYYDPYCGCCKYHQSYPYRHHWGGIGGGKGGSGVSDGAPNRSRGIGGSGSAPVKQGGVALPKSSESSGSSVSPPPVPDRPNRSRGFGTSSGNMVPSNQSGNVEKKKVEVVPESRSPAAVEPVNRSFPVDTSGGSRTRPKRNSRW